MTAAMHVDAVIDRLGYDDSEDLVRAADALDSLPVSRRHAWAAAHRRLGIDAAFFEGRVPLVYFAGLQLPDEQEVETAVARMHQQTWNQSRAQLLVVVLPNEIRVLDGRTAPTAHPEMLVAESLKDTGLESFTRISLLGGRAKLPQTARHEKPVVLQLREDLRPTREKLIARGLEIETADQLLARCLFAQYLDARGLLSDGSVEQGESFLDYLHQSLPDTYSLFDQLGARFNGDTFTVPERERRSVRAEHLQIIASLLEGSAGTGQLRLIPRYDFSVIPAEVLGGVYEEFVRADQQTHAAFYTPRDLVDAALDEAMPTGDDLAHARVLDPACGSGLFLARAYERLLDQLEESLGRALTAAEMAQVLAEQVFGCDLMEDALRVAALSCYLVLLDRLGDVDTSDWQFPPMLGRNLRQGDFFDVAEHLQGPYHVIASNPPWKAATEPAERYLQQSERPAGSKLTLAEAFFWISLERLHPHGRMALLMPAASLYKQSPNERAFQTQALAEGDVDLIVDFSAFRHQLFADAKAPCALWVVRGPAHNVRQHVTFSAPKPGPVSAATGRIAVDADRIARVPRRELKRTPGLLRRLIFGDLRDAHLIERLCHRAPLIKHLSERRRDFAGDAHARWTVGLGYQIRGGDRNDLALLREIPAIHPDGILPFAVTVGAPIDAEWFHRPRDPSLYDGPRVLLARAVDSEGIVRAAYYEEPASYSETIIGYVPPPSQSAQALALCAFLNSSLARYLLFMTGSSWGVERPQLKQQDIRALPVPFLGDPEMTATLAEFAHSASPTDTAPTVAAIDACLARIYQLSNDELALISDRLNVQLAAFNDPFSSAAYGTPGRRELAVYRSTLQRTLRGTLGGEVVVNVQQDDEGVLVRVGFAGPPPAANIDSGTTGWVALPSETLLVRRPQRAYGRDWCALGKFAERKEVTAAAALHDADEILSEVLRAASHREQTTRSAA
ncbi:MAG TPA: N-6 DNA methylase [Solirubrobacteraceae bacterium]|jgi:SAM-dependent methyltransferase|nr:N-6 DNA methylase [Solirubrobacteraceae bacterium]